MAGVFYARFVPPGKNGPASPQVLNQAQKRKRDEESDGGSVVTSTPTPTKKQKKGKNSHSSRDAAPLDTEVSKDGKRSGSVDSSVQETEGGKESVTASNGAQAKSSDSRDRSGEAAKEKKRKKRRSSGDHHDATEVAADTAVKADAGDNEQQQPAPDNNTQEKESPKKKKKKKKQQQQEEEQQKQHQPEEDEEIAKATAKHSGILSKFQKSAAIKSQLESAPKDDAADARETIEKLAGEPVVAQGLEPLPQPEPAPQTDEKPTYSSLPAWLANPVRASADQRAKFSDLGIDSKLLRTLEDNGYREAFAVQATVIPLLLQSPTSHPGDLCISAATGSGKTLSYVLPLVTALEPTPVPRLRGLIVVPTRELVKQAREACELCATGTGLRIASAVGNVAIKDEQRTLMRVDPVYDPHAFKVQQDTKLTGDDWTKLNLHDYISEAEGLNESLPGYIHKPEPNVDILISTPGRLVDHIRFTKGFTLQHVQWLVIDEADRLLNESFQEWVDVVMTSLDAGKSSQTFGPAGKLLLDLGLPIEKKEPRKVVLSATMTRDVSKLNSLRLANPKLVVIGKEAGAEEGEDGTSGAKEAEANFTLPPTLKEFTVPVGDGSEKPLYLLQLLLSHIKVDISKNTSDADSESEDSSSEDSSSEDSDSSDSESESEDDSSSSDESDFDESSSDESTDSSDASSVSSSSNSKAQSARNTVLIFTKSSESASRLTRLLSLLNPSLANRIGTIIKSNKSSASRKTLTAYRRGKIDIIVATDRASRGLDLRSLSHVVNYDVPPSVTTYVHRVGRTARAGNEGSAWTLVAHREGRWFSHEIVKDSEGRITRSGDVEKVNVKLDDMENIKSKYEAALDELELEVKADGRGKASKVKN